MVVVTKEFLMKGMSSNNGWNLKQLNALGYSNFEKGWLKNLVGKTITNEQANLFIALKDFHFRKKEVNPKSDHLIQVTGDIPWKEQYLHPNWQKVRLTVFHRDNFVCRLCGCKNKTIHAHHLKYIGKFIWQTPMKFIITVCCDCHESIHGR
jgi:hypothetical protein